MRLRRDHGQASVELALLLPLLVLLLLVILQIGLLGRDILLVTHASREAAAPPPPTPTLGAAPAARASGGLDPDRMTVRVTVGGPPVPRPGHRELSGRHRRAVDRCLIGDHTIRGTTRCGSRGLHHGGERPSARSVAGCIEDRGEEVEGGALVEMVVAVAALRALDARRAAVVTRARRDALAGCRQVAIGGLVAEASATPAPPGIAS